MVIDGLRNDFVNKKNMPYVYETTKRSGCHIKTKVESPTVTMPRIKVILEYLLNVFLLYYN